MRPAVPDEAKHLYAALLDDAPSCFLVIYRGKLVYANRAAARLLKAGTPEELLKRAPQDVIPYKQSGGQRKWLADVLAGEIFDSWQQGWITSRGDEVPVATKAWRIPFRDDYAVQVSGVDISASQETELRLREQIAELEDIYKHAPVGLALLDRDCRFVKVNNALARLNGLSVEQHPGMRPTEIRAGQMTEKMESLIRLVLDSGEPILGYEFEAEYPAGSGQFLTMKVNYIPHRNGEGRITGVDAIVQDLTSERSALRRIRQNEQRFRTALKNSPVTVLHQDTDLRYIWGNNIPPPYDERSIIGRTDEDLVIDPEDRAALVSIKREVMRTGSGRMQEVRLRNESEARYYQCSFEPLKNEAGQLEGISCTAYDITELRVMREAVHAREQHVRNVLNSLFVFVGVMTPEGILIDANEAPLRAAGIRREDVVGRPFHETHWWSWSNAVQEQLLEAIRLARSGKPSRYDVQVLMRGELMTIDFSLVPMRNDSGEITHLIPSAVDITQRKKIEEELRLSQDRLRTILENAEAAVFARDLEGRFVLANPETQRVMGCGPEEILGRTLSDLLPQEIATALQENDAAVLATGPATFEELVPGPNGPRTYISVRFPLNDVNGNPYAVCGISTEISARKRIEDALRRSNEDLQQFAYVASHDLQEPLRTITCFTQMLERRYVDELNIEARTWIGFTVDAARRMHGLIADLLAYSRVTYNTEDWTVPVPLEPLLDRVLDDMRSAIAETGAQIFRSSLPTVRGNPNQIALVFQNLISNSIKYRKPGIPPYIRVEYVRENLQMGRFSISDNGIGFHSEYREQIFGIFKRLHGREIQGTGIGLAICRSIVERHGGRIWADSVEHRGSIFQFTLPLEGGV